MTKEEIKNLIARKIGSQGNQADVSSTLPSILGEMLDASGGGMTSITYNELKTLRDEGKLTPGASYRITDYECTTAQENTKSAGHKFDIIVVADDERTLNENARAIASKVEIPMEVYSSSWEETFHYIGDVIKDNKSYYCYESESHDCQMLVDFINFDSFGYYEGGSYPFRFNPNFLRYVDEGEWGDWFRGLDEGETINFKEDPREINYFATSNLSAWQLKYSLDNDAERFVWATNGGIEVMDSSESKGTPLKRCPSFDGRNPLEGYEEYQYAWGTDADIADGDSTDFVYSKTEYPVSGDIVVKGKELIVPAQGKGVIYYMKDEWNNECPYDFKNIMFTRPLTDGYYDKDGEDTFVYTFNWYTNNGEYWDTSIKGNDGSLLNDEGGINGVYGNVIKEYSTEAKIRLNNIVFLSTVAYEGVLYYGCRRNTFGNNCYDNTFGDNSNNNTLGHGCFNNIIEADGNSNTFGDDCRDNTFENNCHDNTFGSNCYSNTFRGGSSYNTLGTSCNNNIFGLDCTFKHLECTSRKTSGISGLTPEFWFNGEKKW